MIRHKIKDGVLVVIGHDALASVKTYRRNFSTSEEGAQGENFISYFLLETEDRNFYREGVKL